MHIHACHDCDLLQTLPEIPPGGKARCARCGCIIADRPRDPSDRPLALAVAALIVLGVANTTPLMGLSVVGRHASTTILGGAWQMWVQGEGLTALVVAFCAAVAPTCYVVCLVAVLLAARHPPAPRWLGAVLRWADSLQPWAMVEVMMLGILVALVKIADLATIEAGIALYAVGVLLLLFPAISVSLDPAGLWERIAWAGDRMPTGIDTAGAGWADA